MEHQQWETVAIRGKKNVSTNNHKPKVTHLQKLMRSIESAETISEIKIKKLSTESRQQIIHKRVELGHDQSKLNTLCSFPSNTIKDIESGRLHPTPKQLSVLNTVLKLSLKYEA